MKIKYFRDGQRYTAVTDQVVLGGSVHVGKGPVLDQGVESVKEQAYYVAQISKWTEVQPWEVPDEWMLAFGYEAPVAPPQRVEIREPKVREPQRSRQARARRIEIDVTWWPFNLPERKRYTNAQMWCFLGGLVFAGVYCLLFCN